MRKLPMVLIAFLFSGLPTHIHANPITTYVQQALTELGYDPGVIDGQWGGKTREALNQYRSSFDLEPAADITGSSLYLLHKDAPGEATLPNPGFVVEGFAERRAWLRENPAVAARHCNNRLQVPTLDVGADPVLSFIEEGPTLARGFVSQDEDWYSPISEGLALITADCMAGNDRQCQVAWDYVVGWAEADALNTPVPRVVNSERFDGVAWMANSVLQPFAFVAALSEQFLDVPFHEKALVYDWLYDRVNHYNFLTNRVLPQDNINSFARNHAMAAVLPSMTLGVVLGDRTLFERGEPQFRAALDSMRADGSFPTETVRGSRALHYSGLQLSYLFAMAEIARAQNTDFYNLQNPQGGDLHRAIEFVANGWEDWNGVVLPYARDNRGAPLDPSAPTGTYFEGYFGWLPIYAERFPDHTNIDRLRDLNLDPVVCSDEHIAQGRSRETWCRTAGGSPLTLQRALLDDTVKMSIFNHFSGFNTACAIVTEPDLLW